MWDFIWEMTGQGMQGIISHCKIVLIEGNRQDVFAWPAGKDRGTIEIPKPNEPICHEATWFGLDLPRDIRNRNRPRAWLNIAGGIYASFRNHPDAPRNSTILMTAVEPMFEFRSKHFVRGNVVFYHGVGGGYQRFFGDNFRSSGTDRLLLKFRPVGVALGPLEVNYNLRIYPDGFVDEDFLRGTPPEGDRAKDVVHGFSVNFNFR